MDDQERVAIQNVVKGRQPKLIQLEAKNSGVGEDGASKTATGASVTKLASPSKDPKKRKCPDCDFTYVLQIQLNRHALVCLKKKATESPKIKKWKIKVRGDLQEKSPKSPVRHPNGKIKKPKKNLPMWSLARDIHARNVVRSSDRRPTCCDTTRIYISLESSPVLEIRSFVGRCSPQGT